MSFTIISVANAIAYTSSFSTSYALINSHDMDSIAAIEKQKDVGKYKSYNYEYTILKAFDNKAATDARNAGAGATKGTAMGLSARKLTTFGGSMRRMNMKKSRAQSVYIRGI